MIPIEKIKEAVPEGMELGFALLDTKTGEKIFFNAEEEFPLASVSKFVTAVAALSKSDVEEKSVKDAISVHSKEAFEELLETTGQENLNSFLKELGLRITVDADNADRVKNSGTPASVLEFLRLLHEGKLLSSEKTETVKNALKNQEDPDGFGFHLHAKKWLHMTGGLEGVCVDAGYVPTDYGCLIVVGFVKADPQMHEWKTFKATLGRIGNLIAGWLD